MISRAPLKGLVALAWASSLAVSASAEPSDRLTCRIAERLDQFEAKFQTEGYQSSGGVMILQHGEPVYSRGVGFANYEWRIGFTPDTRFRVMSLSKPLTAIAIMALEERGQLGLQDRLCDLISDCPLAWSDVTVSQLLSHTSGIQDAICIDGDGRLCAGPLTGRFAGWSPDDLRRAPLTTSEGLEILAQLPKHEADRAFEYSNGGYYLLGLVIEAVTGKDYESAMRELVFEPAGMSDTGLYANGVVTERIADGYTVQDGVVLKAPYFDATWFFSAGALYSTVEDLGRLDRAIEEGRVLRPETWRRMFTPVDAIPEVAPGRKVGLGWWSQGSPEAHPYIFHYGAGPGFSSVFRRYHEDGITMIALTNLGTPFETAFDDIRTILVTPDAPLAGTSRCAERPG